LVRQPNSGVSLARNRGIELARYPLIAFLDADDEWMPEFLEASLRMHQEHPHIVASFTNYQQQPEGKPAFREAVPDPRVLKDYFAFCLCHRGRGMWSSAVVARHDTLSNIGGFPVGRKMGEDLDTWARLAWSGCIGYLPTVLAIYYVGEGACAQSERDAKQGKGDVFCDILETYVAWSRAGLVPAALAEASAAYAFFLRLFDVHTAIRRDQPDLVRLRYAGLPRRQRFSVMGLCGYFALCMPVGRRPLLGLGSRAAVWLHARRWRTKAAKSLF
jgi:glycosyltransferase involved in cell wall biosynthesis